MTVDVTPVESDEWCDKTQSGRQTSQIKHEPVELLRQETML